MLRMGASSYGKVAVTFEREGADELVMAINFSGLPGWLIWFAGDDYISGD
jgi:hypothetical protein